jgi:hypothetical protein
MGQITERLRYFEGQFLRSGDFAAEQAYHLEMRRRLNLRMGLVGIVSGAEIRQDENSVPPPTQQQPPPREESTAAQTLAQGVYFYSVAPGLVIDQLGREIYISAPTSLTPLLQRAKVQMGANELWIYYTEAPSGSPAPGYQLCDQLSQQTRFTESFDFVLRPCGHAPDPNVPDPYEDLKGVPLGVLNVVPGPCGLVFSAPQDWWRRRRYAGIRAQKIVAPDELADSSFTFDSPVSNLLPPHGYIRLKTKNGVYAYGNMIVQDNILIGEDFGLDPSKKAPVPLTKPGNLKVSQDIFLQGKLYKLDVNGNWAALEDYINGLVSCVTDIQIPTSSPVTITISGATGSLPSPSPPPQASATTKLKSFSNVKVYTSIVGFKLVPESNFTIATWNIHNTGLTVSASPDRTSASPATPVNITVTCSVTGDNAAGKSMFESVDVALIVIFYP